MLLRVQNMQGKTRIAVDVTADPARYSQSSRQSAQGSLLPERTWH